MQKRAMGIFWYASKSDYDSIRALAGLEDMPSTFEEWVELAKAVEEKYRGSSIIVVRAVADADTFFAFCADRGLDINAKARTGFAGDFTARLAKGKEV